MNPAEMLEGMRLPGGWEVVGKITKKPNATGGYFSTGYRVRNEDGRDGFLKAMDFSEAFDHPDPAFSSLLLCQATTSYEFEKTICEKCADHYLRRVVHAIASGSLKSNPTDKYSIVNYLIFELADGDVRSHLDAQDKFDLAFALRTLHNVAVALRELHAADIAHQDLKPSNVLVFSNEKGSKVGDLGRSWSKSLKAPHDDFAIAGDKNYAPPEFLYREVPGDEGKRRFGCDIYHLGSLTVFLFTKTHMNALLIKNLALEHRHHLWGGTYAEVLPYILEAFAKAVQEFSTHVPEFIRPKLTDMVKQLCDPDPKKRGHPLNRCDGGNQHSLERYMSILDLLAFLAETNLTQRS